METLIFDFLKTDVFQPDKMGPYGAMKVLCTGLVECGGVLVENSKAQVSPTRGQKIKHAAPLPHAQLGTVHTT